ncbi:histone H3-like centromeric protein [Acrasis kona]|uniref:Histone H3-like centromeric protein n=1 Tax=Acrasis kona TaxID=1008807 RepID=A0AAW2ZJR7_9EUKA
MPPKVGGTKTRANPQGSGRSGAKKRLAKVPVSRKKPNDNALNEIRKFQSSTSMLIPSMPMSRLIREISAEIAPEVSRWNSSALDAIRESAEAYLVKLMEDANVCAQHAKRVTIQVRGIKFFPSLFHSYRYTTCETHKRLSRSTIKSSLKQFY